MKRAFYTVRVMTLLSTRRFFRDRLALFFGIAFPVIFLFVFGGIFGKDSGVSFHVALINNSQTAYAKQFESELRDGKIIKVDKAITTQAQANEKMTRSQIDATLVLPPDFGTQKSGQEYPSGQVQVVYTQKGEQAGRTLESVLQEQFKGINAKYVQVNMPFTAVAKQSNERSLSQFDYTFAGLLGFSIIGLGIFGPVNVFPELKKQGILRRLHTTPLRVWQYFLANMFSQALIGMVSLGVMFALAISVFHLRVVGNYFEIVIYLILSIFTILGLGLAIGGWASNERQAAPLSNIVVFPLMFLSGTFFPRFLMPTWLQHVSDYLPLTPVIDGIRLMTTEGKHLIDLGPQLGLMAAWMIVIYAIAFKVFRWE